MHPVNTSNKQTDGVAMVLLAALCWSLNSPLVKSIDLSPFLLAGMRALIAGVALSPFIRKNAFRLRDVNFYLFIVSYIAQGTCIVLALRMTSTPIAVGAQFTAPIWLYLLELKKGDKPTLKRIWPLLALLAGLVLFMLSKSGGTTFIGNLFALATSLTFAAVTYFSKKCSGENPLGTASLSNLTMALVLLVLLVPEPIKTIASIPAAYWPRLIILGVLQTGGGYAFYYIGLRNTKASTAAIISPLEMVLGPIWVALFLHEYPDVTALFGFAFVIAGVLGEAFTVKHEESMAKSA